MAPVKWGIIGVGDVTEVKSGPAFRKIENSALVAVMRRTADLAKDYAQRHGVARWYADADELLADPEVDAVYIATPPDSHKQYTLKAAAAGKPVYVEKPMALNYTECLEMIDACDAAGVPLWVAYYRRALPRFLKIRELLHTGAIGEPRLVNICLTRRVTLGQFSRDNLPWRVRPEIAGGGIFVDLASHTLDYLDYFLGPIGAVQGHAGNQASLYPAEDTVAGSFAFESGVHGAGTWCFDTYANLDMTEITGTKGKLSFSTFGTEPILLETAGGVTEFSIANPNHVQQPLIQTIVDELNGTGQCPSTGRSAARTSRVLEQMIQNYYS